MSDRVPNSIIRTLQRAAQSVGSVEALAAKLEVTTLDLNSWIAGIAPPPSVAIYCAALDIVADAG
jgi:hypothetical protein